MASKNKVVAFIPARSGSKRIKNKNTRELFGKSLISYAIESAFDSGAFDEVVVSTDTPEIADIAKGLGASVPSLRPKEFATDSSPDIEWLTHGINNLMSHPIEEVELVAILRPTSPLRTGATISQAITKLRHTPWADSLRAMEVSDKHPGKMWILKESNEAAPFLEQKLGQTPTHSLPTQSLQKVWVQNASLEIVRLASVLETKTISGNRVLGFEMPGYEGFDLNTELDWMVLEQLMKINIDK